MVFFLLLVSFGILAFLFYNVHYLVLLLSIEMILLGVVFFLAGGFFSSDGLMASFFFFLLLACMGGFSVALLVSLFRGLGRDFWFGGSLF